MRTEKYTTCVRLKHSFWGIWFLTSMRTEMGSVTVIHKGEKNQMGFNTTLPLCACMSLVSFYCVTFTLVNATLLNEWVLLLSISKQSFLLDNELRQARSAGDGMLPQRYTAPLRARKEKILVPSVSTGPRWLEESDYDLVLGLMKEMDVLAKYLSLVFDCHRLGEKKKTPTKLNTEHPNQPTKKPQNHDLNY